MKLVLVVLAVLAYVSARPRRGRIIGGQDATSGQFPFVVALNDGYGQYCNGAIITPSWILTSGQCLYYFSYPSTEVYIGSHLNLINGTAYKFAERIIHESYNDSTGQNDIALIRIDGMLEYSDTIQPIEIGEPAAGSGTMCTALGWGATETEDYPETLQYVEMTVLDMAHCQNISASHLNGNYLGFEQVCTLGSLEQGICSGDAGGPLVCDGKLVGINSYRVGYDCGGTLPDVYIRPGAYADWIKMHIQT